MTVCMLAYTFYDSDNRVRRYAEALARRGDRVDAIVLRQHDKSSHEIVNGVNVYRIQGRIRNEQSPFGYLIKLLLFFMRSFFTVTARHLKTRYDVIHVHSVPDFEVFATTIAKMTGARIILDLHDLVPELYASKFRLAERSHLFRLLLLVERASIAWSDYVISANHLWYDKLTARAVSPDKCTAIINYPDPYIFYNRPRTRPLTSDFLMCYPGTLNSHQGLDLAIEVVAALRNVAPNLKLLIIGDGPEREKLKAMIDRAELGDRIRMEGLIPMESVAAIMANVDLGIVPKRSNSFGNEAFSTKIMEFMAMGVPVLISKTRIDQYYFDDSLVQFFESDNVADLAAKILNLMEDAPRREQLRSAGTQFISKNNWHVRKHQYFELVDTLVDRRVAQDGQSQSYLPTAIDRS
jgi:glycosyltransferase involved in cell wall biosynthesis